MNPLLLNHILLFYLDKPRKLPIWFTTLMSVMFPPIVRKFHFFSLESVKDYLVARVFEIITHFFAFDAGPDEFGEALGALHSGEGAAGHKDGLHRRHLVLL
jgi:hypothetical protein